MMWGNLETHGQGGEGPYRSYIKIIISMSTFNGNHTKVNTKDFGKDYVQNCQHLKCWQFWT